jgi:NADPH2:quinone reductase
VRAVVCEQYGPPESLRVLELPAPAPEPGQAVVAVHAAGLNFPDVLIIENKYQVKPPLPFTPGSEFAGVVTDVGAGVDTLKPGDRVMGAATHGAFAEKVAVDAARLWPIPNGMDDRSAAAFLLTYATCDHALYDRARLTSGETLLVLGAGGGIGLAAIEVGAALGARVVACASDDRKLEACRQHGADATINYEREDLREAIRRVTGGRGADVICDPVGGRHTEPALRSIAWRGRLLVIGFAAGEIPKIPLNLVLLKGCAIVGVFWGEFSRREPEAFAASVRRLSEAYVAGKLRPHVSATFPLERAGEALRLMANRGVVGKLVLMMANH